MLDCVVSGQCWMSCAMRFVWGDQNSYSVVQVVNELLIKTHNCCISLVLLIISQLLILILLRGVSTQLVLTTTCFGIYIDRHQIVHFLIIKQIVQYAMFVFFFNEISLTSIKFAFKIIAVTVIATVTAIILDANFIGVNEISLTKTQTLYIVQFAS